VKIKKIPEKKINDTEHIHEELSEEEILHNRIRDINPVIDEKPKKLSGLSNRNVTYILLTVTLLVAIAGVAIIIKTFYNKPQIFQATKKKDTNKNTILPFSKIDPTVNTETDNADLKKGLESFSKGYYSDAFSSFQKVVESGAKDKDKAIALIYMGIVKDLKEDYDGALKLFQRAITYDKGNADIYKNMALTYRHKKDYKNAALYGSKAIELKKDDVQTLILMGNIYYEKGDNKKAIELYRKALALKDNNGRVQYNLAIALYKEGEELSAIEFFKKAAVNGSSGIVSEKAYARLGILYTKRKMYSDAEKYLKRAIALKPSSPLHHYNLGIAYLNQNKKQKALESFMKAEELGAKNSAMLETIGETYHSLNRLDRSLAVYNKLIENNSRNVRLLSKMAEIHYEKGNLDEALTLYKKIIHLEPLSENARIALLNIGNIQDDTQKYDAAISSYKKAISINPKDDAAYYNLGIVYKHAGQPENAIAVWRKGAALNKKNPRNLLAIGDLYFEKKAFDEAERTYQKIVQRWPNNQTAHYRMGVIYNRQKRYKDSLMAFQRTIKANNKNDLARKALIQSAALKAQLKDDEKTMESSMRDIQKALILKPNDPEALYALGIIYSKKEMHNRAIETFYQALKATRNKSLSAQCYNNIGKSYYNLKKYRDALQAFTRASQEDPSNEEIIINKRSAAQKYEASLLRE